MRASATCVETTVLAKVIVFGSYARGDAREGSDLDLIVVEREIADHTREYVRLRDAVCPPIHVSMLSLRSSRTLRRWLAVNDRAAASICMAVGRRGKRLERGLVRRATRAALLAPYHHDCSFTADASPHNGACRAKLYRWLRTQR